MISRSDIIEAVRMQSERIKKGQGYRRGVFLGVCSLFVVFVLYF